MICLVSSIKEFLIGHLLISFKEGLVIQENIDYRRLQMFTRKQQFIVIEEQD